MLFPSHRCTSLVFVNNSEVPLILFLATVEIEKELVGSIMANKLIAEDKHPVNATFHRLIFSLNLILEGAE